MTGTVVKDIGAQWSPAPTTTLDEEPYDYSSGACKLILHAVEREEDGMAGENVDGTRYVVVVEHVNEFPEPIMLKADQLINVGREDNEEDGWANWFFCQAEGQSPGWVPGQIIKRLGSSRGVVLEDYTAQEMSVERGQELEGVTLLNGWVWCRRPSDGQAGWVPLDNLAEQ